VYYDVCRCFGVEFGEGYGLTETCAALSTTHHDDLDTGHVGVPVSCCEVKLGTTSRLHLFIVQSCCCWCVCMRVYVYVFPLKCTRVCVRVCRSECTSNGLYDHR